MTDEHLNPDTYEQLYFLNIESQYKTLVTDIEKFCSHMKQNVVVPEDISIIVHSLYMYEMYFLSYEPIAQRLDKIGRPKLYIRLNEILDDIKETAVIFKRIH